MTTPGKVLNTIKHPLNSLIYLKYVSGATIGSRLRKISKAARRITHHAAETVKHPKYTMIYLKLRNYTMIPHEIYAANLKLSCSALSTPGAVVECGTWKGGMIAGMAMLFGCHRDYYLFDSFEGLPPAQPIDGKAAIEWQSNIESEFYYDNCTASERDAAKAMLLADIRDAKIQKGWFENTLPHASFPRGIAVLRMDADWYESTYQILESLFPFVNEGGLLIIDDYHTWDGCSKAVHDYLSKHKRPERINSYLGVCFIRKLK